MTLEMTETLAVLSESYLMNTKMTGLLKSLHPCTLGECGLSIRRVKSTGLNVLHLNEHTPPTVVWYKDYQQKIGYRYTFNIRK